jgi:Asp-tRNA(Asn)/Glu-tRNA(Gln) amidotransferase A subunit family amidase
MNPFDKSRSCGGSSGGDAGLVASRCVPIALGSDIGGSIRIPANFNGIVGFKPTQNRLTYIGGNSARATGFDQGMGHFQASGGPLAHSVRDCIEFFKIQSIENAHLTDPYRAPVSFRQDLI